MKKTKFISLLAVLAIGAQSAMMPILANAEASAMYIENSDFSDCAIGGAVGKAYYGLNILLDGGPWLSKGSATQHYETYMHDDERNVNYCNFYSNSEATGSGSGSMYVYQRDTTSNFAQTFGHCKFDIRMNEGQMQLQIGSFSDPTSNTDYIANTISFNTQSVSATNGGQTKTIASIKPGEWYTVDIAINNPLQEVDITVADSSGKIIGQAEGLAYQQQQCEAVRIWCFGYVRGIPYNYDLTNVTIEKSTDTTNPYEIIK